MRSFAEQVVAEIAAKGFNPDQNRVPAGSPGGGQFGSGSAPTNSQEAASRTGPAPKAAPSNDSEAASRDGSGVASTFKPLADGAKEAPSGSTAPKAPKGMVVVGTGGGKWQFVPTGAATHGGQIYPSISKTPPSVPPGSKAVGLGNGLWEVVDAKTDTKSNVTTHTSGAVEDKELGKTLAEQIVAKVQQRHTTGQFAVGGKKAETRMLSNGRRAVPLERANAMQETAHGDND